MKTKKSSNIFTGSKLLLILLPLIFLPVAAFTIIELSRISENESTVRSILENQLNSILFSVNQYSQDVVSGWASEIDREINSGWEKTPVDKRLSLFLQKNKIRKGLIIFDGNFKIITEVFDPQEKNFSSSDKIDSPVDLIKNDLLKLKGYLSEGYRKIEPSGLQFDNYKSIQFLLSTETTRYCILFYDSDRFVREFLSAQMNRLAEDKFVLRISAKDRNIYSTSNENQPMIVSRNLWISPDLEIRAGFKGNSLNDFLQERYKTNLLIIIFMFVFSLFLFILIFRLVQREVKLARLKSDFVSNVSHELRTPLSLISLYGETLELNRVKSEEKRKEYYSVISCEARRLSALVNKILSFSKIESGNQLNSEKLEINQIVRNSLESFRYHLESKNFKCSFEENGNPLFIQGDRSSLTEAILNLLENAIKYSEDERSITIKVSENPADALISIADKGIGIRDSEKAKIFEKFYRINSGLTNNKKGTGIGLSIVQMSVSLHKGNITVEDNPGGGSVFIISLPKIKPELNYV